MRQTRAASSACPRSCSSISATRRRSALRVPRFGARRRRAAPEGQGECAEFAGAGRHRFELPAGRHARRLGDEGPGEDAVRLRRVAHRVQGHLGRAQEERGPRARIPLLRRDRLQGVDELRPRPGRLEEGEERPCGRGETGRLAQRRLQHPPGPGRLPGRDRHRRSPEPERGVLRAVGARVEVALQDGEGLHLAPGVHVGLEEVERGLVVGRIEIEGAGERVDGAVGIAEPGDEQELRQAEIGGHRRREVAGAAREPRELLAQAGPVLPLPVPALQQVERARVAGGGEPRTVEGLPGHGCAVGVVGHVQRREAQPDPRRRRSRSTAARVSRARAWSRQVRGAERSRSRISTAPGAVRLRSIASTVASRASNRAPGARRPAARPGARRRPRACRGHRPRRARRRAVAVHGRTGPAPRRRPPRGAGPRRRSGARRKARP